MLCNGHQEHDLKPAQIVLRFSFRNKTFWLYDKNSVTPLALSQSATGPEIFVSSGLIKDWHLHAINIYIFNSPKLDLLWPTFISLEINFNSIKLAIKKKIQVLNKLTKVNPVHITCVSALSWPSGTWPKTCSNGIEILLLKEDILTLWQSLYHSTIIISSPGNLCVIWSDWRLTFACNKYLHFQFSKIRPFVIRYHND